ncbi:MAG: dienelactone hydrolase family protein [Alphaproteobacteria bacterium]
MLEFEAAVPFDGAAIPSFFCRPDADGPYPAVIMHMDAPAIREELRGFARRIAGHGYAVLLPDLYWRFGRLRFDLARRNEAMTQMITAARLSLTNAQVVADTRACLAWLAERKDVSRAPKGVVGWCMSGSFSLAAAGEMPDEFAACATLYGVGMVTDQPDSPHLLAPKLKAELYGAFAEHDVFVPDNVVPDLEKALTAAGKPFIIETFPTTHHGFQFPERTAVYHKDAAEAAWVRIFDLFARRLQGKGVAAAAQ